jgi:hypothetical protein
LVAALAGLEALAADLRAGALFTEAFAFAGAFEALGAFDFLFDIAGASTRHEYRSPRP